MRYITLKWAKDRDACPEAVDAFKRKFGTEATTKDVFTWLRKIDRPDWLAWTMGQDDIGVTEELLIHGADIHIGSDDALREATRSGRLDTVKFLVEHGADVHACDDDALLSAVIIGNLDMVKFLVEHEANVRIGDLALRYTAAYDRNEVAEFLRQAAKQREGHCEC